MTDWVRLWHDMPTDPKWRTIARKSGQPLACVIALFNLMMVNASANAEERGTLLNWNDEDAAAALDMEPDAVSAIVSAMVGKVLNDNRLTGWEKRQPKREDGTAAARKAAWKERQQTQRNAVERNGTQRNAPETETETETDIPLSKDNGHVSIDPEKLMFDTGVQFLKGCGKSESAARGLLGKWKRDFGSASVIEGLGAAQRSGSPDPIAYIEACLRRGNGRAAANGYPAGHSGIPL